MYRLLFLFLLIVTFLGCVEPPDYPDEPVIKFEGISKQYMNQGKLNEDTMSIQFSFTDGDGDIGLLILPDDTVKSSVFLIDSRDGFENEAFQIPFVPKEGSGNGISGTVDIKVYNSCCVFDDGTIPCGISASKKIDTFSYTIFIKDRAGHKSNEIEVGPIYLRCE